MTFEFMRRISYGWRIQQTRCYWQMQAIGTWSGAKNSLEKPMHIYWQHWKYAVLFDNGGGASSSSFRHQSRPYSTPTRGGRGGASRGADGGGILLRSVNTCWLVRFFNFVSVRCLCHPVQIIPGISRTASVAPCR